MIGFTPSWTRKATATFAAVALLAGGASVAATPASAAGSSLYGCPYGAVCVYPQNKGLNGNHPELDGVFYTYGPHNLHEQYGYHTIVNNQYPDAYLQRPGFELCIYRDGGRCGPKYTGVGYYPKFYLSPINSIVLTPPYCPPSRCRM